MDRAACGEVVRFFDTYDDQNRAVLVDAEGTYGVDLFERGAFTAIRVDGDDVATAHVGWDAPFDAAIACRLAGSLLPSE